MNARKVIKSVSRKVLFLAIAAMVALGSVFSLPARVALAAPPDPQDYINANTLARVKKSLSQQQSNVTKAYVLVTDYQNLFTEAEGQSINTTSISIALATFQSQLDAAGPFLTSAADILATHNGFDNNGKVTDRVAAMQTISSAKKALDDARNLLVHAGRDFSSALGSWEKANPIVKRIEKLQTNYQNDLATLDAQSTDLGDAATVATNVQNLVTEAKSDHLAYKTLSNFLTSFKDNVEISQSYHDIAADALSTHAGYDGSGNVTDINDASQTLADAGQNLLYAFNPLRRTASAILRALDSWLANTNIKTTTSIYTTFKLARNSANDLNNSVRLENTTQFFTLDSRLGSLIQAFGN